MKEIFKVTGVHELTAGVVAAGAAAVVAKMAFSVTLSCPCLLAIGLVGAGVAYGLKKLNWDRYEVVKAVKKSLFGSGAAKLMEWFLG